MPCPSASGASEKTINPDTSPPTVGTSKTSHQGQGLGDRSGHAFAGGRHVEMEQVAQREADRRVQRQRERHRTQAGHHANQRAANHHPAPLPEWPSATRVGSTTSPGISCEASDPEESRARNIRTRNGLVSVYKNPREYLYDSGRTSVKPDSDDEISGRKSPSRASR